MTLVGNKAGRKAVLWKQTGKVAAVWLPLSGAATSLAYWLLADQWSLLAAGLGLVGGALTLIMVGVANWNTPLVRLPYVRPNQAGGHWVAVEMDRK